MIQGVDSAATSPAPAPSMRGTATTGKDEFLQLLVAQLQHQDPLNPMQPEQFAAQLAQFTSVEQLISLNDKMAAQQEVSAATIAAVNSGAAVSTLGKWVVAAGNEVAVDASGGDGTVTFALAGEAETVRIRVFDGGVEVGSREVGALGAGRHEVELGDAVAGLEPGRYTYTVEALDAEGQSVGSATFVTGRVDGVRYGPDGPVLIAGPITIPLGNVAEILTNR